MGSSNTKSSPKFYTKRVRNSTNNYLGFSQFSLSNFTSGRSFASGATQLSTFSVSRPWSRVSRREWHDSTLNNPFFASKTAWPVSYVEAAFLPEFRLNGEVTEKSFEVLCQISNGAFGKVYKVRKTDSGKVYAMKVLFKSQIMSDNGIQQVKDEVRIQTVCGHHPFIVNSPFYWQSRRRLFLVSEFVGGGELLQLSQQYGPLPLELTRLYIAEVALAIDFLHNAGVIYRDLKLENILLDDEGHAQLIDFGLSKWLRYGQRTNTLCGTFNYMAPEVLNGEPYGHAVDWWSMGVVACCLITAQFPKCEVVEPLDASSRDLLARLLQVDPNKRLRSILSLQNIAFFKGFSLAHVRAKKVSPKTLLAQHFPAGPPPISVDLDF